MRMQCKYMFSATNINDHTLRYSQGIHNPSTDPGPPPTRPMRPLP